MSATLMNHPDHPRQATTTNRSVMVKQVVVGLLGAVLAVALIGGSMAIHQTRDMVADLRIMNDNLSAGNETLTALADSSVYTDDVEQSLTRQYTALKRMNRAIGGMNEIVADIGRSSNTIASGTEQMSAQSDQIVRDIRAMQDISDDIGTTVEAIPEVSGRTARNLARTNEIADEVVAGVNETVRILGGYGIPEAQGTLEPAQ